MTFDSFSLDARILSGVRALGFEQPTPIQQQAIPVCLEGHDVLGLAQTGTGKTAAFGLPILQRLTTGLRNKPRALILAPTRELAQQIYDSIREMGRPLRPKCAVIYGGVGMNHQVAALRAGAEIVVACPGRLLDHISQRTIDLSKIEVLVLDEADRMLDMGFIGDIRKIAKLLPTKRQTLLFSATMPKEVSHLASELLRSPVRVEVSNMQPVETVAHALYPVPLHLKSKLLEEILRRTATDSILVFVRTKHRAERLAKQLHSHGHAVASLQGNLSQNRRKQSLDGFRDGRYKILVATDIAARGIDVSSISHVINYDMPDTVEAYTHRIGRTGRAARTGDAYTLICDADKSLVRDLEKAMKQTLRREKLEGFDYKESRAEVKRQEKTETPTAAVVAHEKGKKKKGIGRNRPTARRNDRFEREASTSGGDHATGGDRPARKHGGDRSHQTRHGKDQNPRDQRAPGHPPKHHADRDRRDRDHASRDRVTDDRRSTERPQRDGRRPNDGPARRPHDAARQAEAQGDHRPAARPAGSHGRPRHDGPMTGESRDGRPSRPNNGFRRGSRRFRV